MARHKKGSSKARIEHLQKARAAAGASSHDKENIDPQSARLKTAQNRIRAVEQENRTLRRQLKNAAAREKRYRLAKERWRMQDKQQVIDIRNAYTSADRRIKQLVREGLKERDEFEKKMLKVSVELENAHRSSEWFQALSSKQRSNIIALRHALDTLRKRVKRAHDLRLRVKSKMHDTRVLAKMKVNNAYKPEVRCLSRLLVSFGCKKGKVGGAVKEIASMFGVKLKKTMSRRTVQRTVTEGGIMAEVQAGFEMHKTNGWFISVSLKD
jgi:hypothetical protein